MSTDTALLVIDVQMGFFLAPEPVYQGEQVLAVVKTLIEQARAARSTVIYTQHASSENDSPPAGAIHSEIAPVAGELVIQKNSLDAFQNTDLHDTLQQRGIRQLLLAGFATEYAVDTTCRRAYSLGYDVTLIEDAHSTLPGNPLLAPAQIIAYHMHVLRRFATVAPASALELAPAAAPTTSAPTVVQQSLFDL